MSKSQKAHYADSGEDPLKKSVSYEEIMDIINNRHDTERFGDNDIF
jgi:hypothetical protein